MQVLNDTAVSLYEQGQYADAAELAARALAVAEETLGPDNPQIAPFLNNLGVIYYAQGRYSDAAAAYERALRVTEPSLGANHERVVYFREGLTKCRQKMSERRSEKEDDGRDKPSEKMALAPATEKPRTSPDDLDTSAPGTPAPSLQHAVKVFTVQVGAFKNPTSARELQEKLQQKGYDAGLVSGAAPTGESIHKVQVGEFTERKKAVKLAREIRTVAEVEAFVAER